MAYDDIHWIMQKQKLQQKRKGLLMDKEVEIMVEKWKDDREMEELDPDTAAGSQRSEEIGEQIQEI